MVRAILDHHPNRWRVALFLASSSVAAMALGLAFAWIVSLGPQGAPFARFDLLRLLAASLFAPPMLAVGARESVSRKRRRDAWGIPDIAP
jgi:hypothetical protein